MTEPPVIAIDTREQKPYTFSASVVKTLATGDYSMVGMEHLVAVERKTSSDAYSSLGRGRSRFQSEVERLGALECGAIVIEASLTSLMQPPVYSQMSPKAVIGTLLAWSVRYGVHVFFAGDRWHGNALTRVVLEKFWSYHRGEQDGRPS